MTKPMLAISITALLTSCSLVEPIPGSQRVILSSDLNSCEVIGETTVEVLEEMVGIDRTEDAILDDLQTLARNEAIQIKANAIWPTSKVTDGVQTYNLLRCQPNRGEL